jgi:hypothetical protein
LRDLQIHLEPESPDTRPLFEAPREDGCSFRANLEQLSSKIRKAFMKFVSLRRARAHRRGKSNKPASATGESFAKPMSMHHQIHTYTELRQQIHDDLRIQHPEWVQPNGECPLGDSYEARLMELLDASTRSRSNESFAAVHGALEQGLA